MAAGSEAGQAQTIDVLRQQLESAIAERDEARAQQLALADVLQAINASTGDFSAVFHLILERATSLCDAPSGGLVSVADDHAMALANHGMPQALIDYWSRPQYVDPNTAIAKVLRLGKTLHQADMAASEMYRGRVPMSVAGVELGGIRSYIMVPLVNERGVIGLFVLYRPEVRPFSDRQIALVEAFAAQAAVAMENARLLTEQREALEQQTATAEVLEVINASPGNLEPVFGVMLEKAMRLCEAAFGIFGRFDGKLFEPVVDRGVPPELIATTRQIQSPPPNSGLGRLAAGEAVVQLVDLANTDVYRAGFVGATALVDIGGAKTAIFVALRKDGVLRGRPGDVSPRGARLQRQAGGPAAELRHPGRDRHGERPPAERAARFPGTADRDFGHPAGHLSVADRRRSRAEGRGEGGIALLHRRRCRDHLARRRALADRRP